ncbi:uncharacterized protein LOC128639805 [Bombina bombina]|uniref:uncharacterized protein LOC128639805 n=1 Tax=Bombina bombina TaxID=8345 RepID=UPI00235A9F59|nr:uncharacterized protein LOC128639805 [Bombina bombina]
MSPWRLALLVPLVACVLVARTAAQPNCENVPDFGKCSGDATNFCPKDISCGCKDGVAFCSCPYYKGPNNDYWYMGEKCDQLWNTFDLVAVTILPAIALAFLVAVTAQLIHFCKTKTKKPTKKDRSQKERLTTQSHHNQSYIPDRDMRPLHLQNQQVNMPSPISLNPIAARQNSAAFEPSRMQGYNPFAGTRAEEPLSPVQKQADAFNSQQQPRSPFNRYSDAPQSGNYNDGRTDYSEARNQTYDYSLKPTSRAAPPPIPQTDYKQNVAEPSSNGQWNDRSFSFARPQIRTNYGY